MSRVETVRLLNDVHRQFVVKHKLKSSFGWLLITPGKARVEFDGYSIAMFGWLMARRQRRGKARVEFDGYSITVRFRIESESSDHGIAHLSSIRSHAEADVLINNDHLSLETLESAVEAVKARAIEICKDRGFGDV